MGSMPEGTSLNPSGRIKFSKNAFSTRLAPVSRYSTLEVKKLSHSHPPRSREGQSIYTSSVFCLKVSTAAS